MSLYSTCSLMTTLACLLRCRAHTLDCWSQHFPLMTCEVQSAELENLRLCSWVVLQAFRCTECYWLWITPLQGVTRLSGKLAVSDSCVESFSQVHHEGQARKRYHRYICNVHQVSNSTIVHVFVCWMCILIRDAQLLLFMYCNDDSTECIFKASMDAPLYEML